MRGIAVSLVVLLGACECGLPHSPNEDAGRTFDAGPTIPVDTGIPDAGDDSWSGCRLHSVKVLTIDAGTESVAAGISPDGTVIAVNLPLLSGWKLGFWNVDGGFDAELRFRDATISAVSAFGVAGSVIDSPRINPQQAFRLPFGGRLEVLSDAGVGSSAMGINARGVAVGTVGYVATVWTESGIADRYPAPLSLDGPSGEFAAIDDDGVIVGTVLSRQATKVPVLFQAGSWTALPCPPTDCQPLALGPATAVGYAGRPVVPVRWRLSPLEFEALETPPDLPLGQALTVSGERIGGGVVAPQASVPRDGRAIVWNGKEIAWLAPEEDTPKIVSIVGIASDGLSMAANCYDGDRRVACRVEFECRTR